jgi:shikimate kinase
MVKGAGTIFIYGPPGSGKSSLGRELAVQLDLSFIDLDERIRLRSEQPIPEIFADQGEAGFRQLERAALLELLADPPGVLALGGGTLLDERNRAVVEASGPILCLSASLEILQKRLEADATLRPLLHERGQNTARLPDLLAERGAHYASFSRWLDVSKLDLPEAAWLARTPMPDNDEALVFGMGSVPVMFVPIRLPWMRLPPPVCPRYTPFALPDITLAAAAVLPPIRLPEQSWTTTPSCVLPSAAVPVMSVPIRLPCTVLFTAVMKRT